MHLPVHVLEQPAEGKPLQLPKDNICYLMCSNGIFKHVENDFYSVNVESEKIKGLAELTSRATIHLPPLPFNMMKRIESFFKDAYAKFQSEAVVLLYANPANKEDAWHLEVPPQEVSAGHVKYDPSKLDTEIKGYRLFGTVHSHGSMGAFHSTTDDTDEAKFDGLHITIGNVNASLSYSARWIFCGTIFVCNLSEWVSTPPEGEADPAWITMLTKPDYTYKNNYYGGSYYGEGGWRGGDSRFYDDGDDYFQRQYPYKASESQSEKVGFQTPAAGGGYTPPVGVDVERNTKHTVNEPSTTGAIVQVGSQCAAVKTVAAEYGVKNLGNIDGVGAGDKTGAAGNVGTGQNRADEAGKVGPVDATIVSDAKDGSGPSVEAVSSDISKITVAKALDDTRRVEPVTETNEYDYENMPTDELIDSIVLVCSDSRVLMDILDDISDDKLYAVKTTLTEMVNTCQIDVVDYEDVMGAIDQYELEKEARLEVGP